MDCLKLALLLDLLCYRSFLGLDLLFDTKDVYWAINLLLGSAAKNRTLRGCDPKRFDSYLEQIFFELCNCLLFVELVRSLVSRHWKLSSLNISHGSFLYLILLTH